MRRTTETVRKARNLWDSGLSAQKIGIELGVSKNVVIGIAHRNNFPPRPSPLAPKADGSLPIWSKVFISKIRTLEVGNGILFPVERIGSRNRVYAEGRKLGRKFCTKVSHAGLFVERVA